MFEVGDIVEISPDTRRYNPIGSVIPGWVRDGYRHIVTAVDSPRGSGNPIIKGGERCVLLGKKINMRTNRWETGVDAWASVEVLRRVECNGIAAFKPYKVRISEDALEVRKGPGDKHPIIGSIPAGRTYTIVLEDASGDWGRLPRDAGWIALAYTERVINEGR